MCKPSDFSHLSLAPYYQNIVNTELEAMHSYYPVGAKGVLDVGAGQGETVQLFLNHGAERVLAVEGNPANLHILRENFGSDPRVEIAQLMVDGIKIDIDGGERGMAVESELEMCIQYEGYKSRIYRIGSYPHYHRLNAYLANLPRLAVREYRKALRGIIPG